MQSEPMAAPAARPVRASVWIFVSLAGVSGGITLLYLGMRSVMEIGGACAEGNTPFVPVRPCPKGVPLLMLGGIWGGLVFAGIYAWQVSKHAVPSFLLLLWPALFLSLGWNFLEYGLDPPGEGTGLAWGWLVCAVVFAAMGGLPLLAALPALARRFRGEPPESRFGSLSDLRAARGQLSSLLRTAARASGAVSTANLGAAPGGSADVVSDLERLDALRRSGALDDEEYERAKRRVLERDRP